MKLTVFKSRRGRPSQYLQQALQLNSSRQPLADMVQNNLNIQENNSTDKVVKQNVLTETATTDEMKENHNILKHPASQNTTSTKSPEKFFGSMDNNITLHPYMGNGMSTPKVTVLNNGSNKEDPVENSRTPMREEMSLNSTGSSSSSETDVSRSPMSISDSSLEVSPERANGSIAGLLTGPTETSTPLQPPQQPARRRPGRPPGSTKKPKEHAQYRKKGDSNTQSADDFSLRKFFEAGGRDYNEYLDWLKKRQAQQNATAVMMNQVSSYPNIPSSMIPTTTGVHSVHTTNSQQMTQFAARPAVYSGPKNPMTLPPPPYRPMLVPRPTALPPGVRPDVVPVPSSLPAIQSFPVIPAPAPISPPHRQHTHAPQPLRLPHSQDSNVLDLSAPTRKRKSEGGSSSEDELPSPTPSSAKIFREMTGSPVSTAITSVPPACRNPYDSDSTHTNTAPSPLYKADINGNVTLPVAAATENGELVESSTEPDISAWDVESVVRFINSIPGCQEYSEVFREHRIDGATLPHLSEEHLLNFVKMKLGPAIRLRLAIARLKPTTVQ